MVGLWRSLSLAIVGMICVLAGESVGMTIPLEVGNTWVYEYTKTSSYQYSTQSSIKGIRQAGTISLHIDSVGNVRDSILFVISYNDSFTQVNFADTVELDTVSPPCSKYSIKYLSFSGDIYSKEIYSIWDRINDPFIAYLVEPDTVDSLYPILHYRRASTVSDVRANSLSCNKFVKTTHMDSSWIPSLLPSSTINSLDDTVIWIDRFGLFTKQESVSFTQFGQGKMIISKQDTAWTYTLKYFNGKPFVVGVILRPSSRQSIDSRSYSSLIAHRIFCLGSLSPPYSKSPVFNLRGQPVKNNPAGQLLIRSAIRLDRRYRNHPSTE
jgi:hypothetical protein